MTSNLGSEKIQEMFFDATEKAEKALSEAMEKNKKKKAKAKKGKGKEEEMEELPTHAEVDYNEMKKSVMSVVEKNFRPEFINRIDEISVFHPLLESQIGQIAHRQIEKLNERLKDKGLSIVLSPETIQFLTHLGYDPLYGARPLRRVLQQWLENPLSQQIIAGTFKEDMVIEVGLQDGSLTFSAE
jgi:ATP-dependent Clp protease ATP-binding subunit ClpB